MIRNRTLRLSAAALGAAALLSGCGTAESDDEVTAPTGDALADLEPIVLTVSDMDFETGIGALAMKAWMDEVTEKTDGKVTFETFYGGSLIPPGELVSGLSSRLADIGFVTPLVAPDQLPVANWLSRVDGVTFPQSHPAVVLVGVSAPIERVFSDGPAHDELEDANLVPLGAHSLAPPIANLCTEPVTTPDEADGVNVRVGGQPWVDETTALGMSPVALPHPEVYEALQRGVVDCVATVPSTFLTSGILDIGTDLMMVEFGAASGSIQAFNKDSWDALPLVVQQIMWDATPVLYVEYAKQTLQHYRELIEVAEKNGIEIHEAPDMDEALSDFRAEYKVGLPGAAPASVPDPESYIAELEATVAESNDFMSSELGVSDTTGYEERLAGYANGAEGIDWDLYRKHITELLAPYAPE